MVYNDLGKGVLENAWAGFNTSLFAYGQTGSGKSWSIVGYGANKGNEKTYKSMGISPLMIMVTLRGCKVQIASQSYRSLFYHN